MQGSARRRALGGRNGVVAGSVWETRMRLDEVKGGIKVFNSEESRDDDGNADEEGLRVYRRLRRNQSDGVSTERRKRRNWKPPEPAANGSPIPLRKAKSDLSNSPQIRSENCGGIGEEKLVLGGEGNGGGIGEKQVLLISDGHEDASDGKEEVEIEVEEENKSFDDKEMDVAVEKPENEEDEEEKEEGINQIPPEKPKTTAEDEKRINQIPAEKPKTVEEEKRINQIPIEKPKTVEEIINQIPIEKPKTVEDIINQSPIKKPKTLEERRINKIHEIAVTPKLGKKPTPPAVIRRRAIPIKPPPPVVEVEEEIFVSTSRTQNRMHNIVNLVMWRDVSKSAFVFGSGTFFLISSSYAKDLNFSLISGISYLALVYLALIFLVKSILRRGVTIEYDEGDERCMVGEEEAVWLLRLLLPYVNELLLKLRVLFSGDPETTMKLAVFLFVMARCGGSITAWTLAKLVFFGVFTIPKVYSTYSTQLAKYGKFWLERFRDGWESCTHKKAVAAAVFTLIWNLSSTVARIWAVFMLVVAVKFYQQRVADEWGGQEEEEEGMAEEEREEDSKRGQSQGLGVLHRRRGGPSPSEVKIKKGA